MLLPRTTCDRFQQTGERYYGFQSGYGTEGTRVSYQCTGKAEGHHVRHGRSR